MQLHELKRTTKNPSKKRIGRGGKRGKTSGRGTKGQRAHGSHGIRPEERTMIKKLPKLRGHGVNRAKSVDGSKEKPQTVTLKTLEVKFEAGATVTPKTLVAAGVVNRHNGRAPKVKIVATGDITKKLTVEQCAYSLGAKAKIEAAGGTVVV